MRKSRSTWRLHLCGLLQVVVALVAGLSGNSMVCAAGMVETQMLVSSRGAAVTLLNWSGARFQG